MLHKKLKSTARLFSKEKVLIPLSKEYEKASDAIVKNKKTLVDIDVFNFIKKEIKAIESSIKVYKSRNKKSSPNWLKTKQKRLKDYKSGLALLSSNKKRSLAIPASKKETKQKNTKKTCRAKNQKDKCIVYHATHTTKDIAMAHAKNIKKRGGKVKFKPNSTGYTLEYGFPKKKK